MPRNGAGTYTLPAGNPVVTNTTISSTWANNTLSDIAGGLTQSLSKDGQTTPTNNLAMGGFKLTNLAAGSAPGNSLRYEQLFSQGIPSDIASAGTVDIGVEYNTFLNITGNTTITSFGTNYNGPRILTFKASLTLTHNSTTLILPGAENKVTQAGDIAIFIPKCTVSGTADGWELVSYQSADGNVYVKDEQYDLTNWTDNLSVPTKNAIIGALKSVVSRSYLAGLTLSTSGASTTMTIAAGSAANSTNVILMELASLISKTTSSWVVGSGNGGLDTGTIANSTWYYFYLIRRPDTGVVDVVFSLSSSAPTLPTSYTQYRYIGSGFTNGSGQWTSFTQVGDEFFWAVPVLDKDGAGSSTAVLQTISVPRGIKVKAFFNVYLPTAGQSIYLSSPDSADLAPSSSASPLHSLIIDGIAGVVLGGQLSCWTNTSAQVRYRNVNSNTIRIATLGWLDLRGKDL